MHGLAPIRGTGTRGRWPTAPAVALLLALGPRLAAPRVEPAIAMQSVERALSAVESHPGDEDPFAASSANPETLPDRYQPRLAGQRLSRSARLAQTEY